jgi:hypothetical protein
LGKKIRLEAPVGTRGAAHAEDNTAPTAGDRRPTLLNAAAPPLQTKSSAHVAQVAIAAPRGTASPFYPSSPDPNADPPLRLPGSARP